MFIEDSGGSTEIVYWLRKTRTGIAVFSLGGLILSVTGESSA